MKEIELTQGQMALVDDEDFEKLNIFKWQAYWNLKIQGFYARRNDYSSGKRKVVSISFVIMSCPGGMTVDHKDHNTLDNRKQNLRICSLSQNNQNSKKRKGTSSQYKGVTWDKNRKNWMAQINLRNIFNQPLHQYLGRFQDEKEAAIAYDKAAIENFGEFAFINFPWHFEDHHPKEIINGKKIREDTL